MPPRRENLPNFDAMSPGELMTWMETLVERQGAVEGDTASRQEEIAEGNPDTVADTGPEYILYGMSEEEWARRQAARRKLSFTRPPARAAQLVNAGRQSLGIKRLFRRGRET